MKTSGALIAIYFLAATVAWSDDVASLNVSELSSSARRRIIQPEAFAADGQWGEAVSLWQNLIDSDGDSLIRTSGGFRFVPLRQKIQSAIAALPAEGLAAYRALVDDDASRVFAAFQQTRDTKLVRQILDRYFCSSRGDDALLAAGDLSAEAGRLQEAAATWMRIGFTDQLKSPRRGTTRSIRKHPSNDEAAPRYPDSDLPPKSVVARYVWLKCVVGFPNDADQLLNSPLFEGSGTSGYFAGHDKIEVSRLREFVQNNSGWAPGQLTSRSAMPGRPSTTAQTEKQLDVGSLLWATSLPKLSRSDPWRHALTGRSSVGYLPPAYAPRYSATPTRVQNRDLLISAGDNAIFAFDLLSGLPAWPGAAGGIIYGDETSQEQSAVPRQSFPTSVAVNGSLAFARLLSSRDANGRPRTRSEVDRLVCLDLAAQGRLAWEIPSPSERELFLQEGWQWAGPPMALDDRVFIGLTRGSERIECYVGCYDSATGRNRWLQSVGSSRRLDGELVLPIDFAEITLHENQVYYAPGNGVLATLGAESGRIEWIALYPRHQGDRVQRIPPELPFRYKTTCAYYDGAVIVLAPDSAPLFAFEAATGRPLWRTPDTTHDIQHLLGIHDDTLIASGDRLYAIDPADGLVAWKSTAKAARNAGAGIISNGKAYWPVNAKLIQVVDIATGKQIGQPIRLAMRGGQAGNLCSANGSLVIATADQLMTFSREASSR